MRQIGKPRILDTLGIEHEKPNLIRRLSCDQSCNKRIEAHGFTLPGSTPDEYVRQTSEFENNVIPEIIHANDKRKGELMRLPNPCLHLPLDNLKRSG